MRACLETLPIRNAQLPDLHDHQARVNKTRQQLAGLIEPLLLIDAIQLPDLLNPVLTYKCRVTYAEQIQKIEFELYHPRHVHTLKIVQADHLDYAHKYADRTAINQLYARRGTADDVLMLRDGLLTDTSYANVALFDGIRWYTPARPMLPGTQRARLLRSGILQTADIRPADLSDFQKIKLINAMLIWKTDGMDDGCIVVP